MGGGIGCRALFGLCLFLLLAGCGREQANYTYATERLLLDERVTESLQRAESGDSWLDMERAVEALLDRARLTGDDEDYVRADSLIQQAFEAAPAGAGPFLTRAALNYTLHRFDRVEDDLAKAEQRLLLSDPERSAVLGLRASLALEQGRYEEARTGLEEAVRLHETPTSLARLAAYGIATGDFATAERLLEAGRVAYHGDLRNPESWFHLQLAILDLERGRHREMRRHLLEADAVLPGWWLIEEHLAEVEALLGDTASATERYRDLVARTGNPEFMDALAGILQSRAETAEATRLIEAASAAYRAKLSRFPEAAYGHALDHVFEHGDRQEALRLAEANYRPRPAGEAAVSLARACLGVGDLDRARSLLDAVLESPFVSATLFETAARVAEQDGNTDRAAELRARWRHLAGGG